MKRVFAVILLSLLSVGFLAGCNTVAGAGKDIERAGEGIQDASGK